MKRKDFLKQTGLAGASVLLLNRCQLFTPAGSSKNSAPSKVFIEPLKGEDLFSYLDRTNGSFNMLQYKQLLGAANEFKEGDQTLQVAALNESSRSFARELLGNTKIKDLDLHPVYKDELLNFIHTSTANNEEVGTWTMNELKRFILSQPEYEIKSIMPALSSDVIACLVKLMSNEELITIGQKVFNPLPDSNIGSKGYMGARVQPNSPTDNVEDISWQVFNAWSYAVGDVVLGTNPVSSDPESVAAIEKELFKIISDFGLEKTLPNCVLSHVDIQAEVEKEHPGTTGIWFQSIAGTVNANKTFDVTIDKMLKYASLRDGQFGFYAETGQGADFTNGHGEGFDMVMHESRKYGFLRGLKYRINDLKQDNNSWVHVNDVAGFIGPEVFKSKEQLVRCCLEDIAMGKLHGLTIGLDICSTLHMDINLEDLDWCITEIMPANPAYLMALPTKNDPMLSYLTTAFSDHVRIRHQFGYKVNDAMWEFFKKLEVIDAQGNPTAHFGDPIWVYYKYRLKTGDQRPLSEIYEEGKNFIARIEGRGVPISQGYGSNHWDPEPSLNEQIHRLYDDAKISLWTETDPEFVKQIPAVAVISTASKDRKDYVYHPESGEALTEQAIKQVHSIKSNWNTIFPDIQIIISDGLNARALMDNGHLLPYLNILRKELKEKGFTISEDHIFITNGRVRAGYACGELLFGNDSEKDASYGIVHIIGERPGSGHHNFSAYLSVATAGEWSKKGTVDHNISRVVSGISDTALIPENAAMATIRELEKLFISQNV
ncbi:ethanolamine ammonia-lyase subunit EutB [Robertkochia solimangrovi]|uniref:ethanolamine ammonia-lyase subunit EutB n=1 Tax=Robertkochia solimangrovi TaxID=2213046 RepID=UPI00117C206F|nr:ethanolamine ammonia-lyase subunit EutB [Robertkochia solimangrovi]TRZ46488.1 ethanolamine ammonia-lyase [Robertkochia solimangrovi]